MSVEAPISMRKELPQMAVLQSLGVAALLRTSNAVNQFLDSR
jgi:hypothetical protein